MLRRLLESKKLQHARPAPSPEPKSDVSDFGHSKSAKLGQTRVRMGEGWGEGVRINKRFDPPHPSVDCRTSVLPSPRWGEGTVTAAVLCLLVLINTPAHAQDYPNRPITLVVPYAAGGGNDLFARIASEKMSRTLGQQIVIENRPGAGGSTATRAVAKAAPDGYTLVIGGTGTLAVNPTLYQNVGYDPRKDFAPVGLIGTSALVVLVNPNLPASSIPELIGLAKKEPGKLNYASAGVGSGIHLGTVLFEMMAGVKLTH